MTWDEEFGHEISKESVQFEVKTAADAVPKSLWETYSAFCNTIGGNIFLGVKETVSTGEMEITGVSDADRMVKDIWTTLHNRKKISACVLKDDDVSIHDIDGLKVIQIRVPKADLKTRPVFINDNLFDGTFRRNADGDFKCTRDEIAEMIRDAGSSSADEKILENMGMDCFDRITLERYRRLLSANRPRHPWLELGDDKFLEILRAADKGSDGNMHPTAAGLLMFGKIYCITHEFPSYLLDYRETDGTNSRWSYRMQSQSGTWSGNIFDFLVDVSNRLSVKIGSPFKLDGMIRSESTDTSVAVREALLNALLHADYYGPTGVVVEYSPTELKISNSGTFRISVDRAVRGGLSNPRNRILMAIADTAGFVERAGFGVNAMERAKENGDIGNLAIDEEFDPSRVIVTVGLISQGKKTDSNERAILKMMEEDPSITLKKLADSFGVSLKTMSRTVEGMKSKGLLTRNGTYRGKWIVRH